MDSYEFNKIAGWVLGALLFSLGLSSFSQAVFSPRKPAVAGYALPADEEKVDDSKNVAVTVPLPELLAKADEKKGQLEARNCVSCHIFTETGEKKPGPPLHGVLNRRVASAGGFGYSAPMQEFAKATPEWTYEALDKFLANPNGVVKNTAMKYPGIPKAEARANLILYLRSLAKEPAPLPK